MSNTKSYDTMEAQPLVSAAPGHNKLQYTLVTLALMGGSFLAGSAFATPAAPQPPVATKLNVWHILGQAVSEGYDAIDPKHKVENAGKDIVEGAEDWWTDGDSEVGPPCMKKLHESDSEFSSR